MNNLKIFTLTILALSCFQQANAQAVNWNVSEEAVHIVNISIGWDYSLSYSVGYAYQLNTIIPIMLNSNVSIPSGERLFDDIKVKVGSRILLLNKLNWKGDISINGIFRRYESPLVKLHSFGSELKGTFGYYRSKWFIAGELGFDKAIVTHFNHSDLFKENIFQDVKDGWYEPSTGGNFLYGFQTGYSFKKSDLVLKIGKVVTQDFETTPQIPFYLTLGLNYKIN